MKKVTKAVIPAAGLGSRMFPYTKVESKLMITVLNKPVVAYLVEELAVSGIEEVIIVSDHLHNIKEFFKKNRHLNELLKRLRKEESLKILRHIEHLAKIDLINQKLPMGWMHEVLHAEKYLKKAPFVVCFSDVLYNSKVPAARQIIDKFQETGKNIYSRGRLLFKLSVFEIIEKEHFKLGQDTADLDVIERLRKINDLFEMDIDGFFCDIGDPLAYLKTQTVFGLNDKKFGNRYREFLKMLVK